MKRFFIFVVCMALVTISLAQPTQPKYITEALKLYDSGKYFEAMPKMEEAYNKMTNKGKSITEKGSMAYKLADCYRKLEQYDKAAQWYGSSIELKFYDVDPKVYYYHGEMLRMSGELKKAKESYTNYKNKRGKDASIDVEALISSCSEQADIHDKEARFDVKVEDKLNSKEFDMAPFFSEKKETQFYFGTQREGVINPQRDPITGEKFMDIWVADFDAKGDFVAAKSIDNNNIINTKDNEGTAILDKKGKTLYFTRCPSQPKQNLGCEIWSADKSGEEWENVREINLKGALKKQINDKKDSTFLSAEEISIGHPCLTTDGMMLIFASNMPGGYGGKDLWYIKYDKKAKGWDTMQVFNMGPSINTAGNELFPSLSADDSLLFFASDGHPGVGGLDIFKSSIQGAKTAPEKTWGKPQNLLKPINSASNDYALTIRKDLKSGYFTSERSNPKNRTYTPDIYSFTTPPVNYDLQVMVHEIGDKSKKIVDAKVTVTEKNGLTWEGLTNNGEKGTKRGFTDKWADRKSDKSRPRYINGGYDYEIKAAKARYFPMIKPAVITTKGPNGEGILEQSKSFVVEIQLIPIELRTPEIRYPLDKWSFVDDNTIKSTDSLQFLVDLLKNNPEIIIELYSHTDARDTELHNQALSENRAKAVYNYLVSQDPKNACRVIPFGKGESEPAKYTDEKGEEQTLNEAYINQFKADKAKFEALHQLNRRTTVKIVMEPGTDIPKTFDYNEPCNPDANYFKYTDPLPR
ncbi:MAG: PD40 domain-containing protein [Bacteroidetes bacterium]|nr:PD40 domain-containing protein [Bacteroidota bacterium]